jgi:hypothetical protein
VRTLTLLLITALTLGLAACDKEGCLTGVDLECEVPSPCQDLEFTCEGGTVSIGTIESIDDIPVGMSALGSVGDFLLQNDQVVVVIDALEHPHYLSPTGGTIVDIERQGQADDAMRHVIQAIGLTPQEQPIYTSSRIIEGDGFVALQFNGHMREREDLPIFTRYELRSCEPGIRIRTEAVHLGPDPQSWFLSDAYNWGGKENLPFTPMKGKGFEHSSFGLSTIKAAFEESDFQVAAAHTQPGASYATVGCNNTSLHGFQSTVISAVGNEPRVVMPRDYEVFERFIGAAEGPDVAGAADLALELRRQLFAENNIELSGRLFADGDPAGLMGSGLRASVLISEGTTNTAIEERIPRSEVRPDADGSFAARVPPSRAYVLSVQAYGRTVVEVDVEAGSSSVDAGDIDIPAVGQLEIGATVGALEDTVQVFVHPGDDATRDAVAAAMFGQFQTCAPLLGPPHGEAPACNRVFVDRRQTVQVLPGTYDVVAVAGPWSTLAAVRGIVVGPGETVPVDLAVQLLPDLKPAGTLDGDFHVHGSVSFDSSIPDVDRVKSFLAARTDVIAATDHDVIGDYAAARDLLGADLRMELLVGVETTGHVLQKLIPEATYPQVIGHWNFWPLPLVADDPYRGAAYDELAEPGTLMTRMEAAGWSHDTGIVQLNHPIEEADFGRDLGWGVTLGLNGNEDLPTTFDNTLQGLFHRQPDDADYANSAYHTQEVMNGTANHGLLGYRAFWFYLLNQGVLRAGTANSDSHSITDNVIGSPRTVVWTDSVIGNFDDVEFNDALKGGRAIGTNGPLIEVTLGDDGGVLQGPSLTPFVPEATPRLQLKVSAAPWVPIDEVRIVVNGEVKQTITDLTHPTDPEGAAAVVRFEGQVDVSDFMPSSGDAWVVVEAGRALATNADLNCDGWPDTGDNNGDGTIDWQDVEELEEDPGEPCLEDVGPIMKPPLPDDRTDPLRIFESVTPDGYPSAFTNPLVLDLDEDGQFGGVR